MNNDSDPQILFDSDRRGFARVTVGAFFVNKDRLARLSMAVALGALLFAAVSLALARVHSRKEVLFVVLDPNGNVVVAPGAPFMEAKDLHVQQALLATTALLLRNPKDFDQPEVLQAMFSRDALAQAAELKAIESKEFLDRQIQQKPQITRIEAITTRQQEVQIEVSGQLARWGVVHEAAFTESLSFVLRLVLKPNPDLLRNRRQPTTVTRFTLKCEASRN